MEADGVPVFPSVDSKLSKTELLRGIVCEKLTAAAQEIFAVVERTLSGYEEEAAALRGEIDRHKKQLEAVLQPRVPLVRIDAAAGYVLTGREAPRDKGVQTRSRTLAIGLSVPKVPEPSPSVLMFAGKDPVTLAAVSKHDEKEDVEDKENESGAINLQPSPLQDALVDTGNDEADPPELADSDYSNEVGAENEVEEEDNSRYILLRVSLLQNVHVSYIHKNVLKSRVQAVKCPMGLTEAEFLNLLRSTFPQLSEEIELYAVDMTRRLRALKLKELTPEKIKRVLKSVGKGRSALYIKAKGVDKTQKSPEPTPSSDVNDKTKDSTANDEEAVQASSSHSLEERAESCQQKLQLKEEVENEWISKDLTAPDSAQCAAGSNDGGDVGDGMDGRDEERKRNESDTKTTSVKPKRNRQKVKRKKAQLATKRKRQNSKALTENTPPSCKVCQTPTRSENILIKHSWSHAEDPDGRMCGVCGEQSASTEELKSHLGGHKTRYGCDVCGKNFTSRAGLRNHFVLHAEEKPYKCNICNKTFTNIENVRRHQWDHAEEKPFKCEICDQVFSTKYQERRHFRNHSGERPYTCDLCGKSLADLRNLSRHMAIHSGKKNHSCQVCGKRFLTASGLRTHSAIHSNREKKFLCHICCKAFYRPGELNSHLRTHGEKKVTCEVCRKTLSSNGALKRHLIIHTGERPYKCTKCPTAFKSGSGMRRHMKIHLSNRVYKCKFCEQTFSLKHSLKAHLVTHRGEKLHKCPFCEKAFAQRHNLKTHLTKHQVE